MTIEVRLHGAQGTRTQAVTPTGFTTRHINRATATPSEPVKVTPDLPIAPVSTPEPQPVSENPVGDQLNALLAEVDDLLNPPARENTAPGHHGHHYTEANPPIDYSSPLRAYWDRVMQKRSDERMAYLKNRKGVA